MKAKKEKYESKKNRMKYSDKYDIIVIGGGHAGIEASYIASKMGMKTALLTMNLKTIGKPSCNPSIGGNAKGHLVKEIDTLGGAMPILADKAGIHFKMLNKSKGPAVWSPRAQIDKDLYPKYALDILRKSETLDLIEETAWEIIIEKQKAKGVLTKSGEMIFSKAVIMCPGTFLNGVMYTGMDPVKGGRYGEKPSEHISDKLREYGFETGRLKTGTPPRVKADSVDYKKMQRAAGDEKPEPFSRYTPQVKNRIVCWSAETNTFTHDILRTGFDRSPMYTGVILGTGPRYCPSIEDKIERFSHRESHKILLEPEGLFTDSVYVNGFSTSLPTDIQQKALETIPGLENVRLIRPGYAIEYDFFYPYQLQFTLETKMAENLYFAGQINGTSGYEEAAVQGLIAAINAVQKIKGEEELHLKRSESYIGVLIDDLVNKSTDEPYRIFTSLAEYRLLLRQDNADNRLMKYAVQLGIADRQHQIRHRKRKDLAAAGLQKAKNIKLKPSEVNEYLKEIGESELTQSTDIYTLAKRNPVDIEKLFRISADHDSVMNKILRNPQVLNDIKTEIKYEGYIERQKKEVEYFLKNESKKIPATFDYRQLTSLSNESREKLNRIKPISLGQASRISGVSASDISILSLYLK